MEKKFQHNKKEVCGLCNKKIDMEKHAWAVIIDYSGNVMDNIKFYHRWCLTDLIKGKGKVIRDNFQKRLNETIKNIMGNFGQPQIVNID